MFKIIFLISCFVLLYSNNLFAYIDPGSGLPFLSMGSFLLGAVIAFFGGGIFFVRRFLKFFRKYFIVILVIIGLIGFVIWRFVMKGYTEYPKKIVVLGMDALDYKLMKRFIEDRHLPNFKKLQDIGSFLPLETVCPSESVVAWTSFATGMYPGNHGVFDFIMRTPENYLPFLSLTDISSRAAKFNFFKPMIKTRRKAEAFWEITSRFKVPTYVYFCPNTFPPDKVYGRMISGMGVTDLRGTMGTFSFYTTKPLEKDKYIGGLVFQVKKNNNSIESYLYGPRDTAKSPAQDYKLPFCIKIDSGSDSIVIEFPKKRVFLKEKEWSDWVDLDFEVNALNRVKGICKFYLKSLKPDFELYCSPINFDPRAPVFPITYPGSLSKKIVKEIGLFHTQGMPYDTWALNEERIDRGVFLEQANSVLVEQEKILKNEFLSFKGGLFFYYFEYPDILQHMFWHLMGVETSSYKTEVLSCYKKMDDILGWIMNNMGDDAVLLVLSDHGMGSFERSVHLNSWLRDNGYLYLKNSDKECKEFFENVDWLRTKAYALGFGGIYINQIGREGMGNVFPGREKEDLKQEIMDKLSQWRDFDSGENLVVNKVYTKEEVFNGKFNQEAPDLFVGFNIGYRASWQTALGGGGGQPIENNTKAWASDHIFDPSLVDGVLFVNRKNILSEKPKIIDIVPTLLKMLGIEYKNLDGKPVI